MRPEDRQTLTRRVGLTKRAPLAGRKTTRKVLQADVWGCVAVSLVIHVAALWAIPPHLPAALTEQHQLEIALAKAPPTPHPFAPGLTHAGPGPVTSSPREPEREPVSVPASQPTTAAEPGFETDFTDKPEPAAEPSGKSNSSSPEAHAALAQPAMQTPSPPAASTQLSLPEQEALEREPPIDTEALLSQYVKTVKARILGHKYYPRTAERLGHRGEVVVRFALDASGDLRGLSVESSSGWAELDAASLAAVQNAAPFAALPTALGREELPLVITLKYQLD